MVDSSRTGEGVVIDRSVNERIPTVAISSMTEDDQPVESDTSTKPASVGKYLVNMGMDFLETIVVALSIFVVVYLFLVQPHEVKGSSMEPTFHNNEYILTDKISYRFTNPSRGDVIIFKAPNNPDVDYIKRVIGLPGDRVKVQSGKMYVNDQPLDEPYLVDQTFLTPGSAMREGEDITVPQDDYFAMGDNRPHSSDSREFGPIKRNSIVGRAFIRYWPLSVFGLVKHFSYPTPTPTPETAQ